MQKWGIEENIQALVFDTTVSNTGRINGACTKLGEIFERDLLYLPCRHHIYELELKNVFDTVMGTTSGPDVNIFNRFKASWPAINTTKYCSREDVVSEEVRGNIITFLE